MNHHRKVLRLSGAAVEEYVALLLQLKALWVQGSQPFHSSAFVESTQALLQQSCSSSQAATFLLDQVVNSESVSPPVLMVSRCLLGHPVAYHGRAPRDPARAAASSPTVSFLTQALPAANLLRIASLCPEMELTHLPCPRPPLKLLRRESKRSQITTEVTSSDSVSNQAVSSSSSSSRLVMPSTGEDFTQRMLQEALPSAARSGPLHWDGMLVKSKSPSCGAGDARHYYDNVDDAPQQRNNDDTLSSPPLKQELFVQGDGLFVYRCQKELEQAALRSPHVASFLTQYRLPIVTERDLRCVAAVGGKRGRSAEGSSVQPPAERDTLIAAAHPNGDGMDRFFLRPAAVSTVVGDGTNRVPPFSSTLHGFLLNMIKRFVNRDSES
jgi:uncharacterized protein YbbK (DUF523 family)